MGLFIVREEGGLIEPAGLVGWLLSDAPIWGLRVGRLMLAYDSILRGLGRPPWRLVWR